MRSKSLRLKDRAWKVFSLWIRARDGKCVTCGERSNLQAGHFFHNVLDFDEENVNAQCARCNKWLHGNLAVYANYLLNKLGQERFEALNLRHYKAIGGEKRSEKDFELLIKKYEVS